MSIAFPELVKAPMRSSKLVLVSLVIAIVVGLQPARAASCATASLSAYQALGAAGCSIGSLTFSDFVVEAFPGPSAMQIAAGAISVTPLANGFSLSSTAALAASSGELLGLRFLFDVGASSLIGATVALGGQAVAAGDGVVTALLDAGAAGNAIAIVIDGFSDTPASFASAPTLSYAAFLELGIDGGTFGSASLGPTLASLTFSEVAAPVPEPGVAALSLIGLAALFMRRRLAARRL